MNEIKLIFTFLFVLTTLFCKSQDLVRLGTFSYNGTIFKVSISLIYAHELSISVLNDPDYGSNPSNINGTPVEEILPTMEFKNSYDYDPLLLLFSNYSTLKKDGEYIKMTFAVNGYGKIIKIYFYIYGQTKITQQDLGKFYQKVKSENSYLITSRYNNHQPIKFLFRDTTIKFNDSHQIPRKSIK
ncbi:hypothetical protein [Sphingobacterium cellulitidis]|uniref:hypothetical protein n=1 Tax=Sphingobacterium cellulitidis TaxID=1768011 RepID=UPI000B93DD01|nr:hypothetical protein CHT99_01025 [Sphingobacterium cellulitidis]